VSSSRVNHNKTGAARFRAALILVFAAWLAGTAFAGKEKPAQTLVVEFPAPYEEMLEAIHNVAASGSIAGSNEYAKDETITGARAADSSSAFGAWSGAGKAFYKIRTGVLSPAHFVASNDSGAVTVRYVVEQVGAKATRVSIDAVFVEDSHRHRHPSDGAVESAELQDIQQELNSIQEKRVEALRRAENERVQQLQQTAAGEKQQLDAAAADVARLEQQVQELRRHAIARVKSGAEVKAAPFSRAAAITSVPAGETVEVLVTAEGWCRVHISQGQDGWLPADSLESQP